MMNFRKSQVFENFRKRIFEKEKVQKVQKATHLAAAIPEPSLNHATSNRFRKHKPKVNSY
jgi:hypothetical protein